LGVAVAAAAAGLVGLEVALAQGSADAPADLSECVDLESPEERFACYEARRDAVLEERERAASTSAPEARPPDPEPPPAEAAATAPDSTAAPGSADSESAAQADEGDAGLKRDLPPEVRATITALRETVPNSYIITLDNGQVWRQMRPKWYPLRVGHEVRIYPTGWGTSYRLSAIGISGFIQVERAR
jgi:hypothetical protein